MLSRSEVNQLVDALRRQMLYQVPQPVFVDTPGAGVPQKLEEMEPDHLVLKMRPKAYIAIMQLIGKAGGWTLPEFEKAKMLKEHAARARAALADGRNYDFAKTTDDDLRVMYDELERVPELADFRRAVTDELITRRKSAEVQQ
jgi:hypothetical protein